MRSFFDLIRQKNVTFRLVSSAIDPSFDAPTVVRAADRARVTTLTEEPLVFEGELGGVLPERRLFEYRTGTDRATIIGGVSPELPDEEVATMNQQWVGKPSRATVIIKQVIRGGNVSRETFSMTRFDGRANSAAIFNVSRVRAHVVVRCFAGKYLQSSWRHRTAHAI